MKEIVSRVCEGFLVPGKQYHAPLPDPLREWYAYCSDGGHCVVCCLRSDYQDSGDLTDFLLPVPVKAVLRGYEVRRGYIIVDLPYSPKLGLITNPADDEF